MIFNKNKRGVGFIFLGIIVLLLILSILSTPLLDKKSDPIGSKQYAVLHTNEKAQIGNFYLKESTKLSSKIALDKTIMNSGVFDLPSDQTTPQDSCGEFIYKSYSTKDSLCLPDFKQTFKYFFSNSLSKSLSSFKLYPLNFMKEVDVESKTNSVELNVDFTNELSLPIESSFNDSKKESKISAIENNPSTIKTIDPLNPNSVYYKGVLGGYGNEVIINCSSGLCFADVANYFLDLYTRDGNSLPYVWGGESPYTYEETIRDKESNKNSIFLDAPVSRLTPKRKDRPQVPTVPGFDCSGWLWWVGKHAGLKSFNKRLSGQVYYNNFLDKNLLYGINWKIQV
jgi:hypothetical protein